MSNPSSISLLLEILSDAGAKPFLVPAMGSHGGATPEGQESVLAEYGITRATMGVPFETSMEVRRIGKTPSGREVVFSAAALKADGVIAINRIKPHTDFYGQLGSGLQKMLTIGFGKHVGAANAHGASSRLGHEVVIRESARVIFDTLPVLGGIAILEDQHHQTADIQVIRAADIPAQEDGLLVKARSLMARLPFDEIDLLIVDRIGKEISGTGMDTNVIGRGVLGYSASLMPDSSFKPQIFRIFVRDLTEATHGNGIGIGLADFTTVRAVKALNLQSMYRDGGRFFDRAFAGKSAHRANCRYVEPGPDARFGGCGNGSANARRRNCDGNCQRDRVRWDGQSAADVGPRMASLCAWMGGKDALTIPS